MNVQLVYLHKFVLNKNRRICLSLTYFLCYRPGGLEGWVGLRWVDAGESARAIVYCGVWTDGGVAWAMDGLRESMHEPYSWAVAAAARRHPSSSSSVYHLPAARQYIMYESRWSTYTAALHFLSSARVVYVAILRVWIFSSVCLVLVSHGVNDGRKEPPLSTENATGQQAVSPRFLYALFS